jgi:hypothetical protein
MGVAAYNRGSAAIRASCGADAEERIQLERLALVAEVTDQCDQFARAALAFIVSPRPLIAGAVERQKARRGWAKRQDALTAAHAAWVELPVDTMARHAVSVARAQAAYDLLAFAVLGWGIPEHISIPRCVKRK